MKKLTRKNFSDLAQVMLQISDREQRLYVGGGSGTINDPYTVSEFEMMCANGTWNGGYVYGWGYTSGQIEVNGMYLYKELYRMAVEAQNNPPQQ